MPSTKARPNRRRSHPTRLPAGVADLTPDRARGLVQTQSILTKTFERAGYERVFTPLFELHDVLDRGLSEAEQAAEFRLVDPASGEVVVLRPDFTAQVARLVVARMSSQMRPLRLSYEGRVARALDPLGRGLRTRDLFQAGIELIGEKDRWADAEVLNLAAEAFSALDRHLTLELGHAAIAEALVEGTDADPYKVQAALSAKDVVQIRALAPSLEPLIHMYGDESILSEAKKTLRNVPPSVERALDALERAGRALADQHPQTHIVFDLGAQRSHGYYTGLFFAGYVEGASDAVVRGGRYDDLLGRFGSAEPAVGMGIDVRAVVAARDDDLRQGVVIAAQDPLDSHVQTRLGQERAKGRRAVAVHAPNAYAYGQDHGYAAMLEAHGGKWKEVPIEPNAEPQP